MKLISRAGDVHGAVLCTSTGCCLTLLEGRRCGEGPRKGASSESAGLALLCTPGFSYLPFLLLALSGHFSTIAHLGVLWGLQCSLCRRAV